MLIEELSRYKEKPQIGTRICYVSANGEVNQCMWDDGDICNQLLDFGNCYPVEMKPTLILAVEGTKILRRLATGGDVIIDIAAEYITRDSPLMYDVFSFEKHEDGIRAIREITPTRLDAILACGWPIA